MENARRHWLVDLAFASGGHGNLIAFGRPKA